MSQPQQNTHHINGLGHFDIAGPDLKPLQDFYSRLFDWQITPRGPGYALVTTPDGSPNGAIVENPTPALTLSVVVADLAAALVLAEQQGGRVVLPVLDNGWVRKAQIADPAGNLVTLIEGR